MITCANCDHTIYDCLECPVQMGTDKPGIIESLKMSIDSIKIPRDWEKLTDQKIFIQIYNEIQLILRHIRYEQYQDAEKVAAEISVNLAMLAAESRKG